jgi:K+/H+ antiporter YhaU regulatory subunit KhtT
MAKTNEKLSELWEELSPKAKQLVMKVLKIEKEKLHMGKPLGVNDEILSAIDEVVPEE